jgi:hypothetical protein
MLVRPPCPPFLPTHYTARHPADPLILPLPCFCRLQAHNASPPLKAVLLYYGLYDLVLCGTTPKSTIYLGLSGKERAFLDQVVNGPALTSADHERERPGPRRMWMTAVRLSLCFVACPSRRICG